MRSLLVLVPLLFACKSQGHHPHDSDGDTDDTDDTDVEIDPASCPAYSGFTNPDQQWTFESNPQFVEDGGWYAAYTNTIESMTVAENGQSTRVVSYSAGESDVPYTDEATFTSRAVTRCDIDGVWLVSLRFDFVYTILGTDRTGYTETIYTEPDLIWQRGADVGSTWTSTPAGSYDDGEGPEPFSFTVTHEVTEAGSTTVPGGTFDTLTLASTLDDGVNEPGTTYQWVDRDLGAVLSDVAQLTGHNP